MTITTAALTKNKFFITRKSFESSQTIDIDSLKLKSKSLGINKGLFIKSVDGEFYRLKHLLDLTPSLGGSKFHRDDYLDYYKDYIGV